MVSSRLRRYFDRVGFDGDPRPTLSTLNALQRRHALSVTFENLDVQLGRPLTTDVDAAFEKIVVAGRGGWCYEQNGVFGWALAQLGFEVTRVSAAVERRERGDIASDNHLCLLVSTPDEPGRRYLADVGFGGSLVGVMALEERSERQAPFRVGLRRLDDGHWQFWEDYGKGEFSFDFLADAGDERALAGRCEFLQSDPRSGFVLNLVVQRRLPGEHRTLRGRVMTVVSAAGVKKSLVGSADELIGILRDAFGLDLPQAGDLWPRVVERHEQFLRDSAGAD